MGGLAPVRGRLLHPWDDRGVPAAVISASIWLSLFNGREHIDRPPARINGRTVSVVGVATDGFRGLFMPGFDPGAGLGVGGLRSSSSTNGTSYI
jgi:hypothetical protein